LTSRHHDTGRHRHAVHATWSDAAAAAAVLAGRTRINQR